MNEKTEEEEESFVTCSVTELEWLPDRLNYTNGDRAYTLPLFDSVSDESALAHAMSEISIIGTYIDTTIVDGQYVDTIRLEPLPDIWSKNGYYYEDVLIMDPAGALNQKPWNIRIERISNDKVVETMNFSSEKSQRNGDKYSVTSFSNIVPNGGADGPYTVRYRIEVEGGAVFEQSMQVIGDH